MRGIPTVSIEKHLVFGLGLTALAGAVIGLTSPSSHMALPVLFGLISLAAVKWAVRTRPLRWFDPLVWMVLPLSVMFVARPLALLAAGQLFYRGYDLSHSFDQVMLIAVGGLVALCGGYAASWPASIARRTRPVAANCDEAKMTTSAYVLVMLGAAGYAVFAAKSGLSPAAFLSQGIPQGQSGGSQGSTAYFYLAPLFILPATLLLLHAGLRRHSASLLGLSATLLVVMLAAFAPTGSRFETLMFAGAYLIYPLISYDWRPPVWLVVLGLCVVLIFVQATAGASSGVQSVHNPSLGRAIADTVEHPARSAEQLVLGPTIEMFDGLGVEAQVVPSELGYHPLTSLTTVLAAPVPRSVWGSKPYVAEAKIDAAAFGVTAGSASVAFSVLGGFYYDSGAIGVLLGMALIGALLRFISEYLSLYRSSAIGRLMLSATLPLVLVLARGTLSSTLAQAIFVVAPIPVVGAVAAIQITRSGSRAA